MTRAAGPRLSGGLTRRVAMGSALLALLIGGVFAFLVTAITGMRDAAVLARHSEEVLAAANDLERLMIDLETGERGLQITGEEAFLQPWTDARAGFGGQAAELRRLASGPQAQRADQIIEAGESYINDYSDPLVRTIKNDPAAAKTTIGSGEGKQRMDRLRGQFTEFVRFERSIALERDARSDATARRAVGVAVGGVAGSVLLIVVFSGYLPRHVIGPIRRTSVMAGELARGDLTVRTPESGQAEIGDLQRSFNSMATSLGRNHDELTASRARVVAAGDAARRRIERDLHDGTQQRLITLSLELRMLEADVPPAEHHVRQRLSSFVRELTETVDELREISRGIHPAVLMKGGLATALTTIARRAALPVDCRLRLDGRLSERTEVAVYYVVCEALTNAARHAHASHARIELSADGDGVRLCVRDDGVGGADPAGGTGLIGLRDRIEALGGEIQVISPVNGGTTLLVRIPDGPSDPAGGGAVEK